MVVLTSAPGLAHLGFLVLTRTAKFPSPSHIPVGPMCVQHGNEFVKFELHSPLTSERKLEFQRRGCGNCSCDSDVAEVRDELTLHCKKQWCCSFEHAEGSSQVHDELTFLNMSHLQRVLSTEFYDDPNTRILASMISTPNQLDCGMSSQTAALWSESKMSEVLRSATNPKPCETLSKRVHLEESLMISPVAGTLFYHLDKLQVPAQFTLRMTLLCDNLIHCLQPQNT